MDDELRAILGAKRLESLREHDRFTFDLVVTMWQMNTPASRLIETADRAQGPRRAAPLALDETERAILRALEDSAIRLPPADINEGLPSSLRRSRKPLAKRLKRLHKLGLVDYQPHAGAAITPAGRALAGR